MLWNGTIPRPIRYQGAGSPDTGAPSVFATQSPTGGGAAFYLLTIEVSTVNTYTLRATPTGAQVSDSCGNLELTHTGAKISYYCRMLVIHA